MFSGCSGTQVRRLRTFCVWEKSIPPTGSSRSSRCCWLKCRVPCIFYSTLMILCGHFKCPVLCTKQLLVWTRTWKAIYALIAATLQVLCCLCARSVQPVFVGTFVTHRELECSVPLRHWRFPNPTTACTKEFVVYMRNPRIEWAANNAFHNEVYETANIPMCSCLQRPHDISTHSHTVAQFTVRLHVWQLEIYACGCTTCSSCVCPPPRSTESPDATWAEWMRLERPCLLFRGSQKTAV